MFMAGPDIIICHNVSVYQCLKIKPTKCPRARPFARCSWLIIDYEHQSFSCGDDHDDHDDHDDIEDGGCVSGCGDTKVSRVELQDSRQGLLLVGLSFRIRNDDNDIDDNDNDDNDNNGIDDNADNANVDNDNDDNANDDNYNDDNDDNDNDENDDDDNADNDIDDNGGNDTKVSGLLLSGLNF